MIKRKILNLLVAGSLSTVMLSAEDTMVKGFLEKALKSNPSLSNVKVEIKNSKEIKGLKGWKAQNVIISADLKEKGKVRKINEPSTYFSNGIFMTNSLTNMKTGMQITLEPEFLSKYYLDKNIIIGNKNSKHKVIIFSDPLCPYCIKEVPKLLRALKKHPKTFAVYYYDFPLLRLHPASGTLVKIGEYLRSQNNISKVDILLDMYDSDINPREQNEKKILEHYNEQFSTQVTVENINTKEIKKNLDDVRNIAAKLNVTGTPSFYFDGNKGAPSSFKTFLKK